MKKIGLLIAVLFNTNQPTKTSCHVNLGFTICLPVGQLLSTLQTMLRNIRKWQTNPWVPSAVNCRRL